MPTTLEGTLSAAGLKFAIVASRFNGLIVEPLIAGAVDAIVRSGGSDNAITIVRCPGAWELPQVVRKVVARGRIDTRRARGKERDGNHSDRDGYHRRSGQGWARHEP